MTNYVSRISSQDVDSADLEVLLLSTNCFQDVDSADLEVLLDYMYVGEASVEQANLSRLIKVAEQLKVRGLAGRDDREKLKL